MIKLEEIIKKQDKAVQQKRQLIRDKARDEAIKKKMESNTNKDS